MEDMDRAVLGDAWRWLPRKTRCMLLASATGLAQLAATAHQHDAGSGSCPDLLPLAPDSLSSILISSTDIDLPLMANTAASSSCRSSAPAAATSITRAVHSMAQQLGDRCEAVCSPLVTAMEIVNLGTAVSQSFGDSTNLSDTSTSAASSSTASTASFRGESPSQSADAYLYTLLMRVYLAAGMALTVCHQAGQRIQGLPAGSGGLPGDTALPIHLPAVHPPTHPQLSVQDMGFLASIACMFRSTVRLSWIAVMGDVAFWQEAAYIMSSQGSTACWNKMLRAPLFAALLLLQLVAAVSKVGGWPCNSRP